MIMNNKPYKIEGFPLAAFFLTLWMTIIVIADTVVVNVHACIPTYVIVLR